MRSRTAAPMAGQWNARFDFSMIRLSTLALLALSGAIGVRAADTDAATRRVLDERRYHLGVAGLAEWEEFAKSTPHGPQLEVRFTGEANPGAATLLIRQRNVKAPWHVLLNGKKIGALEALTQPLVLALNVPAGALLAGENRLTILRPPSPMIDDIVVGEIALDPRPRDELLAQATLSISVSDEATGASIPCRITLVDAEDALAPLLAAPAQRLAVRTGVVYTGDGKARIGVAPGRYVLHASRGFEYSVASQALTIAAGETQFFALQLKREVPTPGYIAADTHIHTLTHSRHGDATVDERMLTIAGEGIELAVATDHNHHADFAAPAARMGVSRHFTPVVGNEVTTKIGHFNAFPVRAEGPVPDVAHATWPELLAHVRKVTGAQVITLNHPRDVHNGVIPLGPERFDAETGELRGVPSFDCDAIEVVTSAAMQSDPMLLFRDWFALLNHGYRMAAIAASDTHHVSEFILGQARTYVASSATDPAAIDMDEIVASFRGGRLLISLGLLTQMTVDSRFGVGDLATNLGETLRVVVDVSGPSWVTADRVELFANGVKVREETIKPTAAARKARVTWMLPRPPRDAHLVAIATGPGVTAPYWEIPRPYQAASKVFNPRVIGATNPIWIDGDGDGKFTALRLQRAGVAGAEVGGSGAEGTAAANVVGALSGTGDVR